MAGNEIIAGHSVHIRRLPGWVLAYVLQSDKHHAYLFMRRCSAVRQTTRWDNSRYIHADGIHTATAPHPPQSALSVLRVGEIVTSVRTTLFTFPTESRSNASIICPIIQVLVTSNTSPAVHRLRWTASPRNSRRNAMYSHKACAAIHAPTRTVDLSGEMCRRDRTGMRSGMNQTKYCGSAPATFARAREQVR